MIPLYSQEEFNNTTSINKLPCQCYECNSIFYKKKKYITFEIINNKGEVRFCSLKCARKNKITKQIITCTYCHSQFDKQLYQIKKSKNHFCSQSCAATYNNTHKIIGYRRSKLELWLESKLPILYPNIVFHFNRKDTINSELDIYIPSLKLAFELNGIFHYEPIFGTEQLSKIKNNDNRKFQACIENEISLCLIDTSQQKKFNEISSEKYLNIIINIIKERLLTS